MIFQSSFDPALWRTLSEPSPLVGLQIGRKSGRVLVTGGDDKKVNMWAIGKPNCILVTPTHSLRLLWPPIVRIPLL